MNKVNKPVFILGSGRCGSTFFVKVFSYHQNLAFLTQILDRYPYRPSINKNIMKALDIPVIGAKLKEKVNPDEVYEFWKQYGIIGAYRDINADDVTRRMKKRIRKVASEMLTSKRNRLLVKLTGRSRMGFFKEIFPDAKFIHVIRDGRAVANSHINISWWEGWGGPDKWGWGKLTQDETQMWERHNQSYVALAAIQWKKLMDSYEIAKEKIPTKDYMEIKYEDLVEDQVSIFRKVTDFCELDWSPEFEKTIKKINVKNMNYKWKEDLTDKQQEILNDCLKDYLEKYGYKI